MTLKKIFKILFYMDLGLKKKIQPRSIFIVKITGFFPTKSKLLFFIDLGTGKLARGEGRTRNLPNITSSK
jgi:hypothetical protein